MANVFPAEALRFYRASTSLEPFLKFLSRKFIEMTRKGYKAAELCRKLHTMARCHNMYKFDTDPHSWETVLLNAKAHARRVKYDAICKAEKSKLLRWTKDNNSLLVPPQCNPAPTPARPKPPTLDEALAPKLPSVLSPFTLCVARCRSWTYHMTGFAACGRRMKTARAW